MNRKRKSRANNPPIIRRRGRRVLPKLSDEQREYVIRRLAAGDTPTTIQRDVRARFGIEVCPQSIAYYDPTRVRTPKRRWAPLFHAARRERTRDRAELTGLARQIERQARRIVEVLEHRVLDGFDAARAVAITDEDRLRALQGFVAKLAVTDPAGLAEIRRALDAPGPHGAAAPATREPCEAGHAA